MADWSITNFVNIITVVSFVLGVIGLYLTLKAWKRKRPIYVIRSNNIFSGLEHSIPDMEVWFPDYGLPVRSLTVTKIAFWNAGSDVINREDVVRDNPLSLRVRSGLVILSVSILERTTKYNHLECALNSERTKVTITLEYLAHNQGALIQLFHTGTGNDDIQFEGTIKGVESIQRRTLDTPASKKQPPRWLAIPALCSVWILLAMLGAIVINPPQFQPRTDGFTLYDYIQIGLLTGIGLVMSVAFAYHMYVTAVPKPLSKIHWD